jgi:hypothetical protein
MSLNAITMRARTSRQVAGPPEFAVRAVCALLALAVSGVHVADQGGIAAFTSPDWLGWSYRLIEAGGVLTAVALLCPRALLSPRLARLGWAAAVLLGTGPFLGYLATRSIGLPGDPGDVGNWDDWVGTVSLILEAALITLSISMLIGPRPRRDRPASGEPSGAR